MFYTPFPYISGKRKIIPFLKLPKELQEDYLEVVHFEKIKDQNEKKYLFIVSHYELGLLGLIVKTDEQILLANYTTNSSRYFSQVVDITGIMNNESFGYDYYGDYEIGILHPTGTSFYEGHYLGT